MSERVSDKRVNIAVNKKQKRKASVIDRLKGKGQCAKVRERRTQQTMQIYLSVQYGTESNCSSDHCQQATDKRAH